MAPSKRRIATDSSSTENTAEPSETAVVQETTTGEETPDPNNSEIHLQQIAIRTRIQQLEELKQLREREAELRRELGGYDIPAPQAKTRRTSHSSTSSSGGEIKIKNIPMLSHLTTFRKRDEWIDDLQRAFAGARKRYRRDYKKILLALDYMDGECRTRWRRYLEEQPEESREDLEDDWDSFQEWTLVLIKDASNRQPMLITQLERAKQREHQSPSDFHIYLDSLERHFERASEAKRALDFYAKLQESLRNHINLHSQTLPNNREDMVTLATRYWDSMPGSRKRTLLPPQDSHPRAKSQRRGDTDSPIYRPRFNPQQTNQPRKNTQGNSFQKPRCYHCNSENHLKPRCPLLANQKQGNDK